MPAPPPRVARQVCPLNPIQVLHQTESKSFFDKHDLDAKLYTFFFR
jgi:hypothetical protein